MKSWLLKLINHCLSVVLKRERQALSRSCSRFFWGKLVYRKQSKSVRLRRSILFTISQYIKTEQIFIWNFVRFPHLWEDLCYYVFHWQYSRYDKIRKGTAILRWYTFCVWRWGRWLRGLRAGWIRWYKHKIWRRAAPAHRATLAFVYLIQTRTRSPVPPSSSPASEGKMHFMEFFACIGEVLKFNYVFRKIEASSIMHMA